MQQKDCCREIIYLLTEIDIASKEGLMEEMIKKAKGKRTIPQIFFNEYHVGGYQELKRI